MKVFLYCAIGLDRYKRECVYSMLSLYRQMDRDSKDKIIVITDDDKWFEDFCGLIDFEVVKIDKEIINKWSLGNEYMYRCKIESIRYCFDLFKTDIVFLDTDTVILNKNIFHILDNLGDGQFYMHSSCSPVNKAISIADEFKLSSIGYSSLKRIFFYKSIEQLGFIYKNKYPISPNFIPYNSGLIALSYSDRYLLSQIEEISDCIFDKYRYECGEEFAFSYVFQLNGCISTVENNVFHYPEAKFARYLVAEALNYKLFNDEENGRELFASCGLNNIGSLGLTISEIPSFVRFMMLYSSRKLEKKELALLDEMYTYVNYKSDYYSHHNSLACYKKYYTLMKHMHQMK